jgi:hypothetical protein
MIPTRLFKNTSFRDIPSCYPMKQIIEEESNEGISIVHLIKHISWEIGWWQGRDEDGTPPAPLPFLKPA